MSDVLTVPNITDKRFSHIGDVVVEGYIAPGVTVMIDGKLHVKGYIGDGVSISQVKSSPKPPEPDPYKPEPTIVRRTARTIHNTAGTIYNIGNMVVNGNMNVWDLPDHLTAGVTAAKPADVDIGEVGIRIDGGTGSGVELLSAQKIQITGRPIGADNTIHGEGDIYAPVQVGAGSRLRSTEGNVTASKLANNVEIVADKGDIFCMEAADQTALRCPAGDAYVETTTGSVTIQAKTASVNGRSTVITDTRNGMVIQTSGNASAPGMWV